MRVCACICVCVCVCVRASVRASVRARACVIMSADVALLSTRPVCGRFMHEYIFLVRCLFLTTMSVLYADIYLTIYYVQNMLHPCRFLVYNVHHSILCTHGKDVLIVSFANSALYRQARFFCLAIIQSLHNTPITIPISYILPLQGIIQTKVHQFICYHFVREYK